MTKTSGIFAFTAAVALVLLSVGLPASPSGAVGTVTPTVTITGNPNPGATGSIAYEVTVTGSAGTPTGSVGVSDGSVGCSISDITAATSCAIPETASGSPYTVTATYSGDVTYAGLTNTVAEIVDPAGSTTTVTDNAGSIATGGTLVFTATVSSPGGTPAGTITWSGASTCSSTTPLSGGGATCSITTAQAATAYSVTATFTDHDGNYTGSNGSDGPVSPPASSQAPLTVTSTSGTYGTALDLATSGGSGNGAVSYAVVDGTASGCSVSVGQLTSSSAGTCLVTATKAAEGNFNSISSGQTTVTLAPAPSTTTVIDNSGSVVTGGTLVYTATVTAPLGVTPIPAGTLAWTGVSCSSTMSLTAGVARCSITNAQAGTAYSATATFTDTDLKYTDSSSSDNTAAVGKANPNAPTITNLPTSGTFGGGFTAVVNTNGDGTRSVTSNTPAVCSTDGLAVSYVGAGRCSLNAQVAAGPNYLAGSGADQTFTIGRAAATTPTITNVPSPANEFFGFTAIVGTTGDGTTAVTSNTPNVCNVDANGLTVTFVGFGACSLTPSVAQGQNYFGAIGNPQTFTVQEASHGYWMVGSDGGIFSFGSALFHGSMGGTPLQRPVVGITPTSTGNGYWLPASDGGIFSFGDSTYYGSLPGLGFHPAGSGLPQSLNAPIVGMVPTFTGHGYFMVASDGGVFAFGDARFEGSCPGIGGCQGAAVAVMPDRTGKGYWLVTSRGGVYAFGDTNFYGAPPAESVPVVGAVATSDGHGYWLLYSNGAVSNFGDAVNYGAPNGYVNGFNPATTIFPTLDSRGYWVASARGDVFSYGDSPFLGSMAAAGLDGEIIGAFGF